MSRLRELWELFEKWDTRERALIAEYRDRSRLITDVIREHDMYGDESRPEVLICDGCGSQFTIDPVTGMLLDGDMLMVDVEDLATQELWSVHLCSFECLAEWAPKVGDSWDRITVEAARRMRDSEGVKP